MKKTKQNLIILDIVNSSFVHPTAFEIYQEARKDLPNISLGTVYRNLGMLVENGIIKKIKCDNNIDRYDHLDFNNMEAHFICINCHKVFDLNDHLSIPKINSKFKVIDYELNYKGICPNCKKEGD